MQECIVCDLLNCPILDHTNCPETAQFCVHNTSHMPPPEYIKTFHK